MNYLLTILIPALIVVESGGNDHLRGDNGRAVGCLQITEQCIEDVNRIYGTAYTSADRLDKTRSIEICTRYLLYYGAAYKQASGREPTVAVLAMIWNGGPSGYKKAATEPYVRKVQAVLAMQARERDKQAECAVPFGGKVASGGE